MVFNNRKRYRSIRKDLTGLAHALMRQCRSRPTTFAIQRGNQVHGTRHPAKRSVRIRASETKRTLITNNLENVGPLRKGLQLFTGSNSMHVGVSMEEASFVVKLLFATVARANATCSIISVREPSVDVNLVRAFEVESRLHSTMHRVREGRVVR